MTPRSTHSVSIRDENVFALEDKPQRKALLQQKAGWVSEPKRAVLCVPTEVSDHLGGNLLQEMLAGLLELPVNIVILGKGSASYGKMLTEAAQKHIERIAIIPNEPEAIRLMLEGSDMALFLADPSTHAELARSIACGTVPLCPANKVVADYNPNQESGEAFIYEKQNVWHCFAAVVRALETFKFPYDWRTIQRSCLEKAAEQN